MEEGRDKVSEEPEQAPYIINRSFKAFQRREKECVKV